MTNRKVVKRYANRKLYDTERSCYVTLDDISGMIKAGEDVQVVDNKSGEDLTTVTFAQIIFESEKKNSVMPLSLLRGLIQDGGDAIGHFYRDQVDTVRAKALDIRTVAEKLQKDVENRVENVSRVFKRGDEKDETIDGESSMTDEERHNAITELVNRSQKTFEELQRNVEEAVKAPVGAVSRYASLGREMDEIRDKLTDLESRLEKLPSSPQ
ncbi:MAG: polyhydroxyalkanoate synthesis regulator DNA-binding domain-containing protein [Myxococcota bacterium]